MLSINGAKTDSSAKLRNIIAGLGSGGKANIELLRGGKKQTLTVTLDTNADELCLTIVDDGKGFDCPVLSEQDFRQGGYGLFSIYERITYMGGDMTIDSSPGRGTRIQLHLPLTKRS